MREAIRKKLIPPNPLDRMISFLSPVYGVKRMRARAVMALASSYRGGDKSRRSLSEWGTSSGDADSDTLPELDVLRDRSRDLVRNNPLATGAINTKVTHVVGTGIVLQSRIIRGALNLTEDVADAWEKKTEYEWRLWSESTNCDVENTLSFTQIQELAFRSVLENGDVFVLLPLRDTGNPYRLQLQLIEADRVCNADNVGDYVNDTGSLSGGIKRNKSGVPVEYHVLRGHPGNIFAENNVWDKIPAFGSKTGRKNVLHLFHKKRVGQTRGVPDLAPVIELIKQLGTYTESEAAAAVVNSFMAIFFKSEYDGGLNPMQPQTEIGGKTSDKAYKMGPAAMIDLFPNEDVVSVSPNRPNSAFDPFILAVTRQIGVALELPYEVLVKHFTASYSAARAALLTAWHYFLGRRKWLVDGLCMPVYELFLIEAVATGRIAAPGFLNDPLLKFAYLNSQWTGPSKGQIDEKKEIEAAEKRVALEVSTLSEETAALTGGDWEAKHAQRVKEINKQKADGTFKEVAPDEAMVQDPGEVE